MLDSVLYCLRCITRGAKLYFACVFTEKSNLSFKEARSGQETDRIADLQEPDSRIKSIFEIIENNLIKQLKKWMNFLVKLKTMQVLLTDMFAQRRSFLNEFQRACCIFQSLQVVARPKHDVLKGIILDVSFYLALIILSNKIIVC